MKEFQVDYRALAPEWGTLNSVHADDVDQARLFALDEIDDSFPEYQDVEITDIREI